MDRIRSLPDISLCGMELTPKASDLESNALSTWPHAPAPAKPGLDHHKWKTISLHCVESHEIKVT